MGANSIYHLDNKQGMDEQGHKRFEGAFKGGNVAGYWNTCGSKEGWAPRTFVSSRDNPNASKQQTIFDYMDEEDMGDHVAGKTITTTAEYEVSGTKEKDVGSKEKFGTIAEGIEGKLVGASYSSIGYKMLKAMKALKYKESSIDIPDDDDKQYNSEFHIAGKKLKKEEEDSDLYYVSSTTFLINVEWTNRTKK